MPLKGSYQNAEEDASSRSGMDDGLEICNGFLEDFHGHVEKHHFGFFLISLFHFISALYLFHQETFVGITNAFFLVMATGFIVASELYQPVAMKQFFLSWNQYPVRGCVLMWLSANALFGSIIFGTLAFFFSLFVLITPLVFGDHAPLLGPVFVNISKIERDGEEEEECKHNS